MPEFRFNKQASSENIQRVVEMIASIRALPDADVIYIFSKYFKPIDIVIPTTFGILANFPSFEVFSQEKIQGFKKLVNEYSDLLTGYIRIGDNVYQASADHEYKIMTNTRSTEIRKALVSRAVRINKFDLSMMSADWLSTNQVEPAKIASDPKVAMKESEVISNIVESDSIDDAIETGLAMLSDKFGDFDHNQEQIDGIIEALMPCEFPFQISQTPNGDGIQIVGQNNIGVFLHNDQGSLFWEF